MMKVFFAFFVVFILLTGCSNRYHCPAFPEEMTVYAPYEKGRIVQFIDSVSNQISLQITDVIKSSEYIESECKCACIPPNYKVGLKYGNDTTLTFRIFIPLDSSEDDLDYDNAWAEFDCNHRGLREVALSGDTILFTKGDNYPGSLDSVQVVKGIGITRFCTFDGRHWHLIR